MVGHLWAGWRIPYINEVASTDPVSENATLFESILASDAADEQTHVLWRGDTCFALLNAYPYTSGHLLVLPKRGVATLGELTPAEHAELWDAVRDGVAALESAFSPEGVNVGLNLGRSAGAGVPDHLHVHIVPRWAGDTNFMTSVADARVLPEALVDTWRRLVDAWPR